MARFQSFWYGKGLPPCQWLCMKSFIDHGHEYNLYSYDSPAVPDGVRVLDANEILPRSEIFFYQTGSERGSVACFANVFRYKLLVLYGGWWVDTDVVCLSSKVPEGELFLEREHEELMGTAVMKFPKDHLFVKTLYQKSCEAGKQLTWGQTGPQLVSAVARQLGLWDQTEVQKYAYPIHYLDAFLPVRTSGYQESYQKTRSASFLHLWNEIFRRADSLALHNPPNGSFLADLYIKHRVQRRFWRLLKTSHLRMWCKFVLNKCRHKIRAVIGQLLQR